MYSNLCISFTFIILAKCCQSLGNVAVLHGEPMNMSCQHADGAMVEWGFLGVGKHPRADSPVNESRFEVSKQPTTSSLFLQSTTIADAGTYVCRVIHVTTLIVSTDASTFADESHEAQLIVIVSTPQCNASHDPFTIRVGGSVEVWCTIITRGNWNPIIEWTDLKRLSILSDSSVTNTTDDGNVRTTTSRLQMVAEQAMQGIIYSSTIRFGSIPANVIPNTTNIPDYMYIWKSQPLNVIFGPKHISFNPEKKLYHPGELIVCSAQSNPIPIYQWINQDTHKISNGSGYLITKEMASTVMHNFNCTATSVDGLTTVSTTIHFKVSHGNSSKFLAMLAIIPVVTVGLGVIFVLKCRQKNENRMADNPQKHERESNNSTHNGYRDAENKSDDIENKQCEINVGKLDGTIYAVLKSNQSNSCSRNVTHSKPVNRNFNDAIYAPIDHIMKVPSPPLKRSNRHRQEVQ